MVKPNVFYGMVMTMAISLSSSCKAAERKTASYRDTMILAKSIQPFTIDGSKPFYQVELKPVGPQLYDASKKIWLLLDDPQVIQDPDGVYEVYITPKPADIKMLASANPGFINVLDIYALTAGEPKKYLVNDLSKHMGKWMKEGQPFPPLVITVLFRGTLLPDNSESKKAGQMTVKSMRIVQEK
jgi:hypothetical protein